MSFQTRLAEAQKTMQSAECLYDEATVLQAFDRMGQAITADLGDKSPLVLAAMNGGVLPFSYLVTRLNFPLSMDYLHATRYHEDTTGRELVWQHTPSQSLQNRHVLIVDDILDEGHTLAAMREQCLAQNPASLRSAVLVQKKHDRGVRPPIEYIGLEVPDRYVFGYGMDYKGFWRNTLAIYAVKEA